MWQKTEHDFLFYCNNKKQTSELEKFSEKVLRKISFFPPISLLPYKVKKMDFDGLLNTANKSIAMD